MKKTSLSHLAAIGIITMLCGLIYVSVQQSYRSAANDPQLQIARDISERLKNNQPIDKLVGTDTVDLSRSLATFIVLYNSKGEPIQSNGVLNSISPQIPTGVFDFVRKKGEDAFSWQPRAGVRMAMVVEPVQSNTVSFVAVGRSLLEVEKRESNLTIMLLIGWLACVGVVVVHRLISGFLFKTSK